MYYNTLTIPKITMTNKKIRSQPIMRLQGRVIRQWYGNFNIEGHSKKYIIYYKLHIVKKKRIIWRIEENMAFNVLM